MLRWNIMHPYNAVHVVRIAGSLSHERLTQAVHQTVGPLLGLTLNSSQGSYCYGAGPAKCEIKHLDHHESIATEIERQLNTPFAVAAPFNPIRFFLAPREGSFALGLGYLHAIADAESVVLLMKAIAEAYSGGDLDNRRRAPDISSAPCGNVLFSHPGAFAAKLAALPSLIGEMRRSCRPVYRDPSDMHNGFALLPVRPQDLRGLIDTAKAWSITVNDLLLAILMKSCALLATRRERATRRKKISVGCIVNTRRDLPDAKQRNAALGLFLGSFVITHLVPPEIALRDLAEDIGNMTREIKRKKLYLATSLELLCARLALCFFSAERSKKFYQKNYPLWGGVTNMNINSIWPSSDRDRRVDYIRAVSTGPATPLVLSFTTVGDAANVGLSYRSTVFSAGDIDRLVGSFLGTMAQLEVCQ